jgi:hypothetical protein
LVLLGLVRDAKAKSRSPSGMTTRKATAKSV